MGKNNIIDFNNYKNSHAPEPVHTGHEEKALATLNTAFGAYLRAFSSNALMMDIHTRVGERFTRLEIIESVSDRVCEALSAAGLDVNHFRIDPVSFERFQTREIDFLAEQEAGEWAIPPELYWNGPYYDWNDQGTLIRAATTVLRHEDGAVELLVDLVKMGEDRHWLMWHDGVWETDDFLEAIEEELRQRQIESLGPAALGYDDEEWENSIDSMMLSPAVILTLHKAGIYAIDELREMTDEELLQIKGIGKARVAEIKEALEYED